MWFSCEESCKEQKKNTHHDSKSCCFEDGHILMVSAEYFEIFRAMNHLFLRCMGIGSNPRIYHKRPKEEVFHCEE